MAMNLGNPSGDQEVMVDMNTTPLIDVMLVLLIMLIITIPVQNHAVKLNMPVGNATQPAQPPVVVKIDVGFDGTILWDGQEIPGRTELDAKLKQLTLMPDQPEVHLRPHKLAKYKYVAMVMASAQRLGVTKIGVVGNEQFVQ